jgi:hypothetical protein
VTQGPGNDQHWAPHDEEAAAEDGGHERSDLISVMSGDENVAKLQLAARWAERLAEPGEPLEAMLRRFQRHYIYIDSVTKLVDPNES